MSQKELQEKIEEEKKKEKVIFNDFVKIADNVKLVLKQQTSTLIAFGTLYKLRSIEVDNQYKEETYALKTDKGKWLFFRKRLHRFHDLKSELDDELLIKLKPDLNKRPLIALAIIQGLFNIFSFWAMIVGIDPMELFGTIGLIGGIGWILTIMMLFFIIYQRQQLSRGWYGAFFVDLESLDTVTIKETKRRWLLFKKEVIRNLKANIIHISTLYTEKANVRELRGFSLEEVADSIDQTLKSERDNLKKERDSLISKIKELTIENEKLREENDELAGKLAEMYSLGYADGLVRPASIEKKETNWEKIMPIVKWALLIGALLYALNTLSGIQLKLGALETSILALGGLTFVIILIILAVNAVRRF